MRLLQIGGETENGGLPNYIQSKLAAMIPMGQLAKQTRRAFLHGETGAFMTIQPLDVKHPNLRSSLNYTSFKMLKIQLAFPLPQFFNFLIYKQPLAQIALLPHLTPPLAEPVSWF